MKKILPVLLIAVAIITYFYYKSPKTIKKVEPTKLKVGVLIPLSGDNATFGFGIKKAIELAKSELSANNIELVYEDSDCTAEKALPGMQDLVAKKVNAVIGEVCSGATLAAAPLANQNKIVLISPSSTSPEITKAGPYIFRTAPSDTLQSVYAAKVMMEAGKKSIAILYTKEEYGIGLAKALSTDFQKIGGKVTGEYGFDVPTIDAKTDVLKALAAKPDAVYVIGNSPVTASVILREIYANSKTVAVYGSEALLDQQLVPAIPASSQGILVTALTQGTEEFAQRYRVKYGISPETYSPTAYDAFKILYEASRTGATPGEEFQKAVSAVSFEGEAGKMEFDENGDVSAGYVLYALENGKFVLKK